MEVGVSVGPYVGRIETLPEEFCFVEVAIGEGERTLEALDSEALAERLADRGFGAVVHLPYRQPLATPVPGIDTATREYLDRVLSAAATLGATTVVAHPTARGAGHDHLTERAVQLRDRAETHGLTVCFETLGHTGGLSLERVGELAEDADAAVCVDVGYAYLESGVDGLASFLGTHGDLVEHLHVHGARHRGDTHIPVGSGDVDFGALGPRLADADPATATIEVFTDEQDYLSASAAHFRATLPTDG
jgi:sugar phosphate isomerase/epimerase